MATPLSIPLIQPGSEGATMLGNFVLGLYRGLDRADKRPKTWREEVEKYYGATGPVPEHKMTWCHATGMHYVSEDVKAPHIVPFFLRHTDAGDERFGSRGPELREPSNALLLLSRIKSWFDQHFLIIVPVDPNETPKITRWKIELIEKSVANTPYSGQGRDGGFSRGHELDGKELKFLNAARPASILLYFRFIMTLVRIRDLQRPGWKEVWAKYFTKPPFPTPDPYLRQSMLLLLTQKYETTDVRLVENWIKGQDFEDPIPLSTEEAARVERRVQEAVELAEKAENGESESEDD